MKHSAALPLILALFVSAPVVAYAQSGGMKGMDMKGGEMKQMEMGDKGPVAKGSVHKANGIVKGLDAHKSTVTLAHSPVPSMKWPSMTMTFKVKNKALLDKLALDKKVDVEFVQDGKDYVVTSVK